MKYVYHSSKNQDLKTIEPRVSTHGKSWVYAMEKPEYCLMFLGDNNDTINQIGFINKLPFIAERFKGSLEQAYKNKSGSIYTLTDADFKSGMTNFNREFVCNHSCKIIYKKDIIDTLEEILDLESKGEIRIYRYPNFPSEIRDTAVKAVNKSPITY